MLAGDRVIYLVQSDRSSDVVYSVRPGEPPRRLLTLPAPLIEKPESARCSYVAADLAASATHLVVSFVERTWDCTKYVLSEKATVLAGPIDGPYRPIVLCSKRSPPNTRMGGYPVAISGSVLAYGGEGCAEGTVILRDLAKAGAPVERTVTGSPPGVDTSVFLAGRYLGVVRGRPRGLTYARSNAQRVDVYASDTGQALYSATEGSPGRPFDVPFAGPYGFDLADDGTLAVAAAFNGDVPACNAITLSTYSPSTVGSRELALRGCDIATRVAGGRVAFVRTEQRGYEIVSAGLADAGIRALARSRLPMDLKDFDGTRFAWGGAGCAGEALFTASVADAPVEPTPLSCAAKVAAGALRARRDGRVSIQVRCRQGCSGDLFLRGPFAIRHKRFFSFTRQGVVRVDLKAKTKRRLEGRRAVRVRVKLRLQDPGGPAVGVTVRRTLELPRTGFRP